MSNPTATVSDGYLPRPETTVRYKERASYDRELVHAVLDEALVAHVGFVADGRPVVIPMLHARVGESLLLHGSPATRLLRLLKGSPEICVSVTLVDGLVLARSAFHHSANYRSVVVFGVPEAVTDLDERKQALDAFTDKLVPGRRPHLRPMTEKEVRGTAVVRLPLDAVSAKVRTGGPNDDDADYELPIWAGVLPLRHGFDDPLPDENNHDGLEVPDHVTALTAGAQR